MKVDEVRERYLKFFESKGHTVYPSDSLVPSNDPSLLFTGAGMNQFKDMFLGKGNLPFKRATTSQKCIRTGDIERVGRTPAHQTFFEMLGNFSFGDYFKKEAIGWGWEFLTRELKIPKDLLHVSVYQDDPEAFDLWPQITGIPAARVNKMGEADNFWPASAPSQGPNGPCGPCSEIYYDFGVKQGCGSPDCGIACNCGRFVEIWNLVFTQFDRRDGGVLEPLPQKNIDTGMGLERISAVMQGVHSNFDTDIFRPLIGAVADAAKKPYAAHTEDGARSRRIADHLRAVTFCIADGVLPANDGRGYVERKLLRIAVGDGRALGIREPFLHRLVPIVGQVMGRQYPEIRERTENIVRIVKTEEEKFLGILEGKGAEFRGKVETLKREKAKSIPGDLAFYYYDSHGLPLDFLEGVAAESGLHIQRVEFEKAMDRQREMARQGAGFSSDIFGQGSVLLDVKKDLTPTVFLGYEGTEGEGKVLAIVAGEKLAPEARKGEEIQVILDRTPFYGESGGQVGDAGLLEGAGVRLRVADTRRNEGFFLHHAKVEEGVLKVGAVLKARVDADRRSRVMSNHTATHMLQSALRSILGTHVAQAGSLVSRDRLRFDFTHGGAVRPEELKTIETYLNERVWDNVPVDAREMSLEEARKAGALMFFGEKYGDRVRVVTIGDFSKEFCGGTHLVRTGTIGAFKVVAESSVGSGVRRIEAVTGPAVLDVLREREQALLRLGGLLGVSGADLDKRVQSLLDEVKSLNARLAQQRQASAGDQLQKAVQEAKTAGGVKIVSLAVDDMPVADLRSLADKLLKEPEVGVALLGSDPGGKPVYIVGVRKDLIAKGLHAGQIAKEIGRQAGGGGGGKDVQAQAGGTDPAKIPEILAAAVTHAAGLIK